jgi:AcrR family transcriptional regulator
VDSPLTATRLQRAERRATIVAAARKVFIEEGFAGARTRTIAAEAGVNAALLYEHFDSMQALFDAAILEPVIEGVQRMGAAIEAALDGVDTTDRTAALQAIERELLTSVKTMMPLLATAHFWSRSVGGAFYLERVYPEISNALDRICDKLGWEPHSTTTLLTLMTWMSLGPVIDSEFGQAPLQSDRIARQLAALLTQGIASPPVG